MSKDNKDLVGKVFPTNGSGDCVVIEYKDSGNIRVKFLEGRDYEVKVHIKSLRSGVIKNPYYPSVYGVGFLGEGVHKRTVNRRGTVVYDAWKSMLARCYCKIFSKKQLTYSECTVHPDWHNFQVFAEWYTSQAFYGLGYDLDKDILFRGNKVYSPKTCSLVPSEVNRVVTGKEKRGSNLPRGVWLRADSGKYTTTITDTHGRRKSLGCFESAELASLAHKKAKEIRVKEVAEKWKSEIDRDVYDSLMRWTAY